MGSRPKRFGEQMTADHFVSKSETDQSLEKGTTGLVVHGRAAKFTMVYPSGDRSSEEIAKGLRHFMGAKKAPGTIYVDNSPEFKIAFVYPAPELDA